MTTQLTIIHDCIPSSNEKKVWEFHYIVTEMPIKGKKMYDVSDEDLKELTNKDITEERWNTICQKYVFGDSEAKND